jgi:hypothetical protein
MDSLGIEDGTPHRYKMKVMSELLTQAHIAGVELEEFIGFFASQIQVMLTCPPNLNMFGQMARIWVCRGFYPTTSVFFKLVLISREGGHYAKVSPLRTTFRGRTGAASRWDAYTLFDSEKLNEDLTNRMENAFLGANHKLDPLLPMKLKMPRCMSPRGMKLFKYKKPRKKKK